MDTTIEDVIAGCVIFGCIILLMLVFGGCASPQIKPALANADGDVQAMKVGEVFPVKGSAELTADVKPVVGVGNNASTVRTTVGGNLSNDSEVMKAYIEANRQTQERLIKEKSDADNNFFMLLKIFIGSLFVLVGKYELQIRKLNNRLMDSLDRENAKDEERLDAALKQRGGLS